MPVPVLNGVEKPADVIARGRHVFDESTRKYKEVFDPPSEFPRAMWHQQLGYKEAQSREQKQQMEAEGWSITPFPSMAVVQPGPAVGSNDLALIVLQQAQQLQKMQEELQRLSAGQPTTAPATPIVIPPLERKPKA
jgi:hypothetical protein